jgi:hypothetical protein
MDYGKDFHAIEKAIKSGKSVTEAMLEGGYSESLAKHPAFAARRSKPLRTALLRAGIKYIDLGRKFSNPEDRKNLVRGALVENVLEGKDKATQSLKMLGSETDVNMFTPETMVGMTVIQVPPDWAEKFSGSNK